MRTYGTNAWYFGGTIVYFATTDNAAAIPNPIAVYPDEGGIGNVGDDTATATAYIGNFRVSNVASGVFDHFGTLHERLYTKKENRRTRHDCTSGVGKLQVAYAKSLMHGYAVENTT